VLIVEEDNRSGGWGAEVAAQLMESAFGDLAAPVVRVAAPDTPLRVRRRWNANTSERGAGGGGARRLCATGPRSGCRLEPRAVRP